MINQRNKIISPFCTSRYDKLGLILELLKMICWVRHNFFEPRLAETADRHVWHDKTTFPYIFNIKNFVA